PAGLGDGPARGGSAGSAVRLGRWLGAGARVPHDHEPADLPGRRPVDGRRPIVGPIGAAAPVPPSITGSSPMSHGPPVSLWPDPNALGPVTDLYELTMMVGYMATGMAEQDATFELFVRK